MQSTILPTQTMNGERSDDDDEPLRQPSSLLALSIPDADRMSHTNRATH
jgi:hypothetical protein